MACCNRDHRLGKNAGLWTNELAFLFLFTINLLNYLDRGIIPGANKEFLGFISDTLHPDKPDLFLGLLQSAFIIGFSVACLVFGHLIHRFHPFKLVGVGLSVWVGATLMSGFSKHFKSYEFLFFARMLSGVGEASFQCVAPPFISDLGGDAAGRWLGLFYSAIPVGTAAGYPWGAFFAKSNLGWSWAFFLESAMMAPLALACFVLPFTWRPERPRVEGDDDEEEDRQEGGVDAKAPLLPSSGERVVLGGGIQDHHTTEEEDEVASLAELSKAQHMNFKDEFVEVMRSPIFILTVLGYAAQTGMMIGISTFGSALLLEFGYYSTETTASFVFGVVLSLGGIIGTPLGGFLVDRRTFRSDESKLAYMCRQNLVFSMFGMLAACLACYMQQRLLFVGLLGLGALLLFAATSSINYTVMLAVPPANRSFAIGLNTLGIHALGDVPSPVIVGAILDSLAPACSSALKDAGQSDSDFTLTPGCKEQLPHVRLTMFITCMWLSVSVLTFGLAYMIAERKRREHHREHHHRTHSILDQVTPLDGGLRR